MDVREKMWRIVKEAIHSWESDVNMSDHITDNLIANGVTVQDNTEITDELLKQLRNAPLTVLHEEPTVEVVQEWISVKDRLPKYFENVLVFPNGKISIDYHEENGWFAYDFKGKRATHWMPLPQPPKGE